jgi:hypothetical protein
VIGAFILASALAASPPAMQDEIVVLAQKLKATRFVWKAGDKTGVWKLKSCKIKQSSGDTELDAGACQAVTECLPTIPVGTKTAPASFADCLTEHRISFVEKLAARRAAAREGER